MQWFTSL